MDVVWLASYPRSGNSWLRFLVTNLINGPFETSDVVFDVTPALETGLNPALLRQDRANFIKTHSRLHEGLPWRDKTKAAVYVVRNPFDAMLSNLNAYFIAKLGLAGRTAVELQYIATRYVSDYLREGGDPRWRKVGCGTWHEHAASWLDNDYGIQVKPVRYEDMLSDPASVLREICDFVGLDCDNRRLGEAVERSSFDRMREMEERELAERRLGLFYGDGRELCVSPALRFMRRGKGGEAAEAFKDGSLRASAAAFMPTIERFGYA